VQQIVSPSYRDELTETHTCEVIKKYDANSFHNLLSGSAYLLNCDEKATYKRNSAGNHDGSSRKVFMDALGLWIHADPVSPRAQIILDGRPEKYGDYDSSNTGMYTLKSFELAR